MYLDTDCVLALVKDTDWLKESVQNRIRGEKSLCTSVLTVVESRLVLIRESTIKVAFDVEKSLDEWEIRLLPLDKEILIESKRLMKKYDFLCTFDAIHIATASHYNEKILSTDHLFPLIEDLTVENPRDI